MEFLTTSIADLITLIFSSLQNSEGDGDRSDSCEAPPPPTNFRRPKFNLHVTFFWLFASCFRLLVFLTKYTSTLYPKNARPHSVCTATESDISVLIEYSNELIFYIFELIVILAYHHRISILTLSTCFSPLFKFKL